MLIQIYNFLQCWAILGWKNNIVAELNTFIFIDLSGKKYIFESVSLADYLKENSNNQKVYKLSFGFLQSINILSLFFAQLWLKTSIFVMLIWNLHDRDRLCNGTRLVITWLHKYCIEAWIFVGKFDG